MQLENTKQGKVFCIADIHGGHRALVQALERANFNKEVDTLITLGDIVDGWGDTYHCVEELLKIPHRVDLKGNHDDWFLQFIKTGIHPVAWGQGGLATAMSYGKQVLGGEFKFRTRAYNGFDGQPTYDYMTNLVSSDIPESHVKFFERQHRYYVDLDRKMLFVHGGFNRHLPINHQDIDHIYWWDRDLWMGALSAEAVNMKYNMKETYDSVFIGHTQTTAWKTDQPMFAKNIINIDTGGGFNGRVTIMNVDTKEYFQSDLVQELYPEEKGRN